MLTYDNLVNINSIKLSGEVSIFGTARAYIERGDDKWLLFDKSKLDVPI